jgi:hypothetical protein
MFDKGLWGVAKRSDALQKGGKIGRDITPHPILLTITTHFSALSYSDLAVPRGC